jgi:predicted nucleic acid-binding protein
VIVLDASALVDVVLDQASKNAVLDQLDQEILAPAHQPVEVLSALARLERAGVISTETARSALRDAGEVVQQLIVPDLALLRRAFELRERIRVADGLYVALAERMDCPLVTTDRRLSASQPPCRVVVAGA